MKQRKELVDCNLCDVVVGKPDSRDTRHTTPKKRKTEPKEGSSFFGLERKTHVLIAQKPQVFNFNLLGSFLLFGHSPLC